MNLFDLQQALNSFDLGEEIKQTIESTSEAIATLNKGQMFIGKLSTGKQIQNIKTGYLDYSIYWGQYRDNLGLQTDHYDFKVTGKFYNSIFVHNITDKEFTIDSTEIEKKKNLIELFTENIFGLNDESLNEEYIPLYFYPELQSRITKKLGIGFS